MKLSLFGISISIFGLAFILTLSGSATAFGLLISFLGVMVSLAACFIKSSFNWYKAQSFSATRIYNVYINKPNRGLVRFIRIYNVKQRKVPKRRFGMVCTSTNPVG